jgi:flagellar FliJ protein
MSRKDTAALLQRARNAKERSAAREVAEGRDREAGERERLAAMEAWREDYGTRQQALLRSGHASAAELARWTHFLETLDAAIAPQRSVVARREAATEASRARWQDRRVDCAVAERFADRVREEARRLQDRREQAAMEDLCRGRRDR